MTIILDALLTFFAAAGLIWVGWLLVGDMFTGGGTWLVVAALEGDGEDADALRRRVEMAFPGRRGLRIVLLDADLTAEGTETAKALAARDRRVAFCPAGILEAFVRDTCRADREKNKKRAGDVHGDLQGRH